MPINLSIRNYTLTIAALDCSAGMFSWQGADSKLDESGLVIFKGSITIGNRDSYQYPESLDDRINDRWSRGNTIVTQIADKSGLLKLPPRGGTLRILEASYSVAANKLTLQVADLLELLKTKDSNGDKTKICPGEGTSRTAIVNTLLAYAGAPTLLAGDVIPGSLNSPQQKIEGSYIEQAGRIAAAAGCFLYVDSQERIRVGRLDKALINSPVPMLALTYADLVTPPERLAGEPPPGKVIVNANATIVRRSEDANSNVTEEFGPAAVAGSPPGEFVPNEGQIIVKRTTITENFDRGSRTKTIVTKTEQPVGLLFPEDTRYVGNTELIISEQKFERFQYESRTVLSTGGAGNCEQGNAGTLMFSESTIYEPRGVAIREVLSNYPKSTPPDRTSLIESQIIQVAYIYDLKGTVRSGGGDEAIVSQTTAMGPLITTRTYRCIGAIIPKEYRYNGPNSDPDRLIEAERNTQYWEEVTFGSWMLRINDYKTLAVLYPSVAEKIRSSMSKTPGSIPERLVALIPAKEQIIRSNSGQAQPPAPETYQPKYSEKQVTVKGSYRLPVNSISPYRQAERSLSFDYISATAPDEASGRAIALSEANYLAEVWGKILWARYKACSYTTDLADSWWQYTPLCRINVREPNAEFAYMGDGWSLAMSGFRCVVGFDGLYLGQVVAVPIALNGVPVVVNGIPQTQPVLRVPYVVVREMQAAIGMAARLTITKASASALVSRTLTAAIGLSARLTIGFPSPQVRTLQAAIGTSAQLIRQLPINTNLAAAIGTSAELIITGLNNRLTEDGSTRLTEDGSPRRTE